MSRACLLSAALCVAVLAVGPSPSTAELCSVDPTPAATLLVPYFEVDLGASPGKGVNTLFAIHNAGPEPALAQITLWTDWSIPTVWFNVFLTGFDMTVVDLGDVLRNGNLPITADAQSDPGDFISPAGAPEWDGSFSGCEEFFPFFVNPLITGSLRDAVQNGHSGYPAFAFDGCLGEALNGDGSCSQGICPEGTIARGYITIDSVSSCSFDSPSDPGYFEDGGTGVANNRNALWGDIFYLDIAQGRMETVPMVHIEADSGFNADNGILEPSVPPNPSHSTFYSRFTRDEGGDDNREPLGNAWGLTYLGGAFQTHFVAWRDSTQSVPREGLPCGTGAGAGPEWNPMGSAEILCFDAAETPVEVCRSEACFPLETQKIPAQEGLGIPFDFGWCRLDLSETEVRRPGNVDRGIGERGSSDAILAQSYLMAFHGTGTVSGGLAAIELAHACDAPASTSETPTSTNEISLNDDVGPQEKTGHR